MVRTNKKLDCPLSTSTESCTSTSPVLCSSPMLGVSPMSTTPPSPSLLHSTTHPTDVTLMSTTPPMSSMPSMSTNPPMSTMPSMSTTPPMSTMPSMSTIPSMSTTPPRSTTGDLGMTATSPAPNNHESRHLFEEVSLGSEFYQVPRFFANAAHAIPPTSPVEVKRTQDRGLGMFAKKRIFPGTVLLVERPLIVMPDKVYYSDNFHKISKWVDKEVSKLGPEEEKCFNSLTDGGGRPGPLNLRARTFFTNDMNYGGEAGLFPSMARANHACQPNADFVSRPDIGVQILVAVSTIEEGEEVFICYLPQDEEGSDVRKVRQNYLRSFYGFRCQCEVCTMRGFLLAQNDSTRAQIREQQEDEDIKLKSQSVEDLQELVHKLHLIGGKRPYILKIHEYIYKKALKSEDWPLVVQVGVAGWNIALLMFGPKSPQEKLWKERSLVKLVTVQMEIEETEKTFRMFETIEDREQEFMFDFKEVEEMEEKKFLQNDDSHEMKELS